MRSFYLTHSSLDTQVVIHRYSLDHLGPYLVQLAKPYSQAILISTPSVFDLYGHKVMHQLRHIRLPVKEFLIPDGEAAKTLQQVSLCWSQMDYLGLDRQSVVIALGGGAVTDLAGFAAACYMRGLDAIFLPTTLLGMVDAAIGGKTAINFAEQKNIIGAYHTPKLVLIDPNCLATLPAKEFSAGLAEIIKYGIISDRALFEELEKHIASLRHNSIPLLEEIIYRSCQIKYEMICQDFKEQGIRAHLNYGHTFAHAIESLTQYRDYLHGEAVAIGMSCAAHLSCQMNLLDRVVVERIDALCQKAGLPIDLPVTLSIDALIDRMKRDKKAVSNKISLILPQKIGKVFKFSDVETSLIKQTLLTKRNALP